MNLVLQDKTSSLSHVAYPVANLNSGLIILSCEAGDCPMGMAQPSIILLLLLPLLRHRLPPHLIMSPYQLHLDSTCFELEEGIGRPLYMCGNEGFLDNKLLFKSVSVLEQNTYFPSSCEPTLQAMFDSSQSANVCKWQYVP
jgi:hypothetical protein